ncbi:MAG: ABC transporter ATP-binding protein [Crocinitomicaceae bacterium]
MARRDNTEKIKLSTESYKKARKFFTFLKPYRSQFIIGWLFLVLSSLTTMAFPYLMGKLFGASNITSNETNVADQIKDLDSLSSVVIALFLIFGFQSIFSFFRIYLFSKVTEGALRDMRNATFTKLINLPTDFFNKNKTGELSSRIATDINLVRETLNTTISEFFRQVITISITVVLLWFISWKLALLMLSTVPVMAIIAVFFGRYIKKLSKNAQDESAKSNAIVEESLSSIVNVKSFTNEVFELGRYKKAVETIRILNVKSGTWRGLFVSFIFMAMFGAIIFVLWQGMIMKMNGEIPYDMFITFLFFTVMMGASFGALPDLYAKIQRAIGATESLMTILDEDDESVVFSGKETPKITGNIEFDHVKFAYPQRKEIEVIRDLSFSVKQGELFAIVGESGAGKSTITQLLLKFYNIDGGAIKFDGVDQKEIATEHLRDHIGLVPQEVLLFSGTIRENIAYGKINASEEEIHNAAKQANALEFINEFPDGFETEVGNRGIQLSGGQKQRIAIARALLKDPEILILDEATSALDSQSERLVQDALDNLMKGRTSIVIAHRLSTIKNADKIIVMEKGQIIQTGNHEELMASNNGKYFELNQLQRMVD